MHEKRLCFQQKLWISYTLQCPGICAQLWGTSHGQHALSSYVPGSVPGISCTLIHLGQTQPPELWGKSPIMMCQAVCVQQCHKVNWSGIEGPQQSQQKVCPQIGMQPQTGCIVSKVTKNLSSKMHVFAYFKVENYNYILELNVEET